MSQVSVRQIILEFFRETAEWNCASLFLFELTAFRLRVFNKKPVIIFLLIGPGFVSTSPPSNIKNINQIRSPQDRQTDKIWEELNLKNWEPEITL